MKVILGVAVKGNLKIQSMKLKIFVIFLVVLTTFLMSCTQYYVPLTPEAENLQAIANPSKVSGCNKLSEVKTVGLTGELNSYRQAMNIMRNRLAQEGASHYSIKDAETRRIATFVHAKGWNCKEIKKIEPTVNFYKDSWIIIK